MTDLVCLLERDFPVCHVRVSGVLGHATAPRLRAAVLKALADRPDLVLIDVSGLDVEDDITLTAFPALVHPGIAVGVPVMLCAPSPVLVGQLTSMVVTRQVPTFASREEANAVHARRPGPVGIEIELPAEPDATAAARGLVDRSCQR
jgi:anti-anti-sigma regulatory factor